MMARVKKPMQGLMLQLLLDLAARGVFTDLFAAVMGTQRGEKQKARVKLGLYHILALVVAVVLSLIALGFVVAAGYMHLATLFAPALAALLTAGALLLVALCLVLLGSLRGTKDRRRHAAAPPGGETMAQTVQNVLNGVLEYARKNMDIIAVVALMIGIWLSMNSDDKDGDKTGDEADGNTA